MTPTQKQNDWAKRARIALLIRLGGKCRNCGEGDIAMLVPNHIDPNTRTWSTKQYRSPKSRIQKYRQDERMGLLECLCVDCNNASNTRRAYNNRREEIARALENLIDPIPF